MTGLGGFGVVLGGLAGFLLVLVGSVGQCVLMALACVVSPIKNDLEWMDAPNVHWMTQVRALLLMVSCLIGGTHSRPDGCATKRPFRMDIPLVNKEPLYGHKINF